MVKNKKSFFLLPLLLILLFSAGSITLASYEKVYDEADLFSEEERVEINDKAKVLSDQTEMDIIIVTTNDSKGKSSSQYALDFYDKHGFGYQGTLDGVLYLLNMGEREVYIFTRDKGTDYIHASRIEDLLDQVYPPLGEENYSESVRIFLDEVEKIMASGPPSNQSGESGYTYTEMTSEPSWIQKLGIYLLISIAIGGIAVGIMSLSNKGRSTVNARTYLQDNSFTITKKRDRHYNTSVTQQKIQSNNNSGHSSGGGGIGGGGRKF